MSIKSKLNKGYHYFFFAKFIAYLLSFQNGVYAKAKTIFQLIPSMYIPENLILGTTRSITNYIK